MKSIDVKSLIIGILGTALVMVMMGQSSKPESRYDLECFSQNLCVVINTLSGKAKILGPHNAKRKAQNMGYGGSMYVYNRDADF